MEPKLKKKNISKIALFAVIAISMLGIGAVSYAMYTYSRIGSESNKLIAGDLYLKYNEGSALNISGAMPSSTYPSSATGNYFQFTITGKNTHETKDISYNLRLAYGDSQASPKQRIADQYLLFKLVEVINGEESSNALVEDANFSTIPGSLLKTMTVPHNTVNETTRTFRLYVRISESVGIGTDTTYTIDQWKNLYASIKINADGGLVDASNEPTPTESSCFETETEEIYVLNTPLSNDAINSCIQYVEENMYDNGHIEDFCNGTGYIDGLKLEAYFLNSGTSSISDIEYFLENNIIKSEEVVKITDYDISCGTDVVIPSTMDCKSVAIIGPRAFEHEYQSSTPKLSSVYFPNTIKMIDFDAFCNNNLTTVTIPSNIMVIREFAFISNPISTLTLAEWRPFLEYDNDPVFSLEEDANLYINGTTIPSSWRYGRDYDDGNAREINLILGNGITSIEDGSLANFYLKSVQLPNSLTSIGSYAFEDNFGLTSITIPSSVTSMGSNIFGNSTYIVEDYTIDVTFANRSCSDIENISNSYWGATNIYSGNHQLCYSSSE